MMIKMYFIFCMFGSLYLKYICMKQFCKLLVFLIVIVQFLSCDKKKNDIVLKKVENNKISNESAIVKVSNEVDDFSFPVDSTLQVKILRTEIFHNDEVEQNFDKKVWFGLFKKDNVYTLSQTQVFIKSVNDPIVDENEEDKTGWEVTTSIKDTCIVLIEKKPYLSNREVWNIKVPANLGDNEDFEFNYKNIEYTLFALVKKRKERVDSEWIEVSDYSLYLRAYENGKETKTLLVAKNNIDERFIEIVFAGDIDGDGRLDLIIDTSNHYNVSSPTLYLSKPASEEKKIIKPVGVFTTVGC